MDLEPAQGEGGRSLSTLVIFAADDRAFSGSGNHLETPLEYPSPSLRRSRERVFSILFLNYYLQRVCVSAILWALPIIFGSFSVK